MYKYFTPIILLTVSNIFMTFAWYGHLKHKSTVLWAVILISWGIAFFEYCFQVPANRIGSSVYSPAQLKTIQEIITLIVFSFFSVLYLKEEFKWNYLVGFVFIILAGFFIAIYLLLPVLFAFTCLFVIACFRFGYGHLDSGRKCKYHSNVSSQRSRWNGISKSSELF